MAKNYFSYFLALLACLAILGYSTLLYNGVKEQHINHFIIAAFIFPIIAILLQKRSVKLDIIATICGTALLILCGDLYWNYQDSLSDFSFENDFQWPRIIFASLLGFLISQVAKTIYLRVVER